MARADATLLLENRLIEQPQISSFVATDAVDEVDESVPSVRGLRRVDEALCPVEVAARIIGQKWTLQIVNTLIGGEAKRFCEIQEALNGVNPSTLTSRLKYLEEMGMVQRNEVSTIPPHVEYSLSEMGRQLESVIREVTTWSRNWLCPYTE